MPLSGAIDSAPVVAAPVTSQPAATYADAPADRAGPDAGESAMWLGGLLSALALAGLGGVAAVAIRRRKKVHAVRLERPIVEPRDRAPIPAVASTTVGSAIPATSSYIVASTTPAFATRPFASSPISHIGQASALDSRGLAHAGAAVPLPRERLATAAERRALIARMVDASPDRANPFRTRKARLHRAKLIEQSIGRQFPGGKSRIDLSQYPMNWPELAPGHPAAA